MEETTNSKFLITKHSKEKLDKEIDQLIKVDRPTVIKELKLARAQGDLSENADYDAARNKQSEIESRIQELENYLRKVVIIETSNKGEDKVVKLGATVTTLNLFNKEEVIFKIFDVFEINPLKNIISVDSPVAKALLGHKISNVVTISNIQNPYQLKIKNIEFH